MFKHQEWTFDVIKTHISTSDEVDQLCKQLELPAIPEMTFGHNQLKITHENGFFIQFNTREALEKVDNKNDLLKVAIAAQWRESREGHEHIDSMGKPYDWSYTTAYRGSVQDDKKQVEVFESKDQIDFEKLKIREKILFSEELVLFEDELADNGIAKLSVKLRVMPSCLYMLMRFFLRVDDVLVRINDTRLYHEFGTNKMVRNYKSKERAFSELKHLSRVVLADDNILDQHLELKSSINETIDISKCIGCTECERPL